MQIYSWDTQCRTNLETLFVSMQIATESNVTSYLLRTVVEAFKGLPVTGKRVIGITTIVCSPTPVRFAKGNWKGLVPAARKRG